MPIFPISTTTPMNKTKTLGIFALGLLSSAAALQATTIYGLTSTNGLISFDSATPGTINTIGTISQPGIVDIDFFPVNGLLYGITNTGGTYSINLGDASATFRFNPLTAIANITDLDFNPVADRMRLFGDTDQNYRMVPDATTAPSASGTAGTVIVDGTFSNTSFQLVSSAYTNNFDGAASTTLYSIDTVTDALIIHSVAPQFNTVTAVGGGLGTVVGANVGFDIDPTGTAYLSDANAFYIVNLGTGVATAAGMIGGSGLVSIAAVPEPATAFLSFTGLALLAARRRRTA